MIVKKNWVTWGNLVRVILIALVLGFMVSEISWSHPIYRDLITLYVV